jgi:hypothetical protein
MCALQLDRHLQPLLGEMFQDGLQSGVCGVFGQPRTSASRPSGEWNEEDFDVLADGAVVGRIFKANAAPGGPIKIP